MKEKNIFNDIISSAKTFVEKQKGAWDHEKWESFLSEVQQKGFALTEEASNTVGRILESLKKIYSLHPEQTHQYNDIATHAKNFVEKYRGLWDHEKWENLLRDFQRNGIFITEEKAQAIGSILESIKTFYSSVPAPVHKEEKTLSAQISDKEKKAYIKKIEDDLKHWDTKIDILEVNADKASEQNKAEYSKHLDKVLTLWKEAKIIIQKLKKSDDSQWEALQNSVDAIWKDMEDAIKKALTLKS